MNTPQPIALPATAIRADTRAIRIAALWTMLIAKMIAGWGVQWDIRWHLTIGRDSFWIAPHVMTYAGVTIAAVVAFAVLMRETMLAAGGAPASGAVRFAGLVGTPGLHVSWWGMAIVILAAPVDDLWHRLFGIDVTLWSPPHLLGFLGGQVNTLGCLLLALEVFDGAPRARAVAGLLAGTMLLGTFYVVVDPAIQTAFRRGGIFFFTYAVLGAFFFGGVLVMVSRLTGWRSAAVICAVAALALSVVGRIVGDVGFAILQPVSAIDEAIAADPDSPIAIAHEMARRSGGTAAVPGRSLTLRILPIVPAVALALWNPRRRPRGAAIAYGLTLIAWVGWSMTLWPVLRHAHPSLIDTAVAVVLTLASAWAGGAAAVWLTDRRPRPITPPA